MILAYNFGVITFQKLNFRFCMVQKCKTNPFLMAKVVYRFTCQVDPDTAYIGKTKRHLGVRCQEHLNIRTSLKSAVGEHIVTCDPCRSQLENGQLTHRNFEILKKGSSDYEIQIMEAILIKKFNPILNRLLFKEGSFVNLKIFN